MFLHTAREGTLASAAVALGINASTVQRRIGKLEKELDVRVFDRSQRGYALTPAGEDLYRHAKSMEEEVAAIGRKVGGRDRRLEGKVRLATVDDMAVGPLAPILTAFRSKHPQVEIELSVRSDFADLSRQQADLAIRFGARPQEADVVARPLMKCDIALYGSKSYLRQHGMPRTLKELRGHFIVRGTEKLARLPMERLITEHSDPDKVALRCESFLVRLAAIRHGLGIGFLGLFAGDTDRRLQRLSLEFPEAGSPIWLAVHTDLRKNARVRALADFVSERLIAQRATFEMGP